MPGLDDDRFGDAAQRRIFVEALENIGEDVVRFRLGNRMPIGDRPEDNPPPEFARLWLKEKDKLRHQEAADRKRYERTTLNYVKWTFWAAVAGAIFAAGAIVVAILHL